jgi:hypothetical protein
MNYSFNRPTKNKETLKFPKGEHWTGSGLMTAYEFNDDCNESHLKLAIHGIYHRIDLLDLIDFLIAAEKELYNIEKGI